MFIKLNQTPALAQFTQDYLALEALRAEALESVRNTNQACSHFETYKCGNRSNSVELTERRDAFVFSALAQRELRKPFYDAIRQLKASLQNAVGSSDSIKTEPYYLYLQVDVVHALMLLKDSCHVLLRFTDLLTDELIAETMASGFVQGRFELVGHLPAMPALEPSPLMLSCFAEATRYRKGKTAMVVTLPADVLHSQVRAAVDVYKKLGWTVEEQHNLLLLSIDKS